MNLLLEVKNLTLCFRGENESPEFKAVDNISFDLHKGEILGIVGESGSGKSVTAHSILGLLPYPKAFYSPESSIKFQGREYLGASEEILQKIRGGKIGFIFQEPMSSLNPLHKIGHQIAETLLLHTNISAPKARLKTIELLKKVGIEQPKTRYDAYPFELSGGQRQRVMIAMAIANKPDILIADEPTTALDVTVQEQIIKLLIELKKEFGMSILFITHDLLLIRRIADRVLVIKQGKIVESGDTNRVFNFPQNPYTKQLLGSFLQKKKDRQSNREICLTANHIEVEFPLKKNFWGKVVKKLNAVDQVCLQLYKGQTVGLVGESGSGKTTLGHCLAGLCSYRGEVILSGKKVSDKEFHRRVQIVFQDPYNSLNPRLNIYQIVSEGLTVHFPDLNSEEKRKKVVYMLEEVGLSEDDLNKYPHEFSGGQRQRIAIARALILNPEVVILDEPTSALDVTIQAQIIDLLKKLQKKFNMAYLFISHDMRAVYSISDQIAVMKNGQIVEQADTQTILSSPQTDYAKQLIQASLVI